jgi:3-deoxy-D-manno-octulosonate 8-phosphate phosphatase (KDO 8-P phosphatase)
MIKEIQNLFEEQGGGFISSPSFIAEKLKNIKAYIFDWDGVFNSGTKDENKSSSYSEVDSMGLNMLRLGYWLGNNKELPVVSIITGENNTTAIRLAEREHINHIYFGFKNKATAFEHLLESYQLKPEEVAFCFDDILDFPITKRCGLKFMVDRKGSPLFRKYAIEKQYCDYITAQFGGEFAVREISELILGLLGQYELAVKERTDFSKLYTDYLEQRNGPEVKKFVAEKNGIKLLE